MFSNIIIGFLIPWIFGLYLIRKAPVVILITLPIASLVALLINIFGFHLNFWSFTPFISGEESMSVLPMDLGLYPVISCYMIHWIRISQINHVVILFVVITFTTFLEYLTLLMGKASYSNSWNIYWTFISYLLAYGIVYVYYRILYKQHRLIRIP
ncbi:CBO0543 family protein [Paenibacillus endoradicis]|uniref:CBO0543 family protein n=1 Tax=Paenibacillus endoradicis TaxID=2972487 RepID=UPI002158D6CA|nr:CBO0543 family protein [Paenibacillus endoradicis]MCR8656526.1 hypothetical protein [Paenibacillus endoradicis]